MVGALVEKGFVFLILKVNLVVLCQNRVVSVFIIIFVMNIICGQVVDVMIEK